jgi:hypothetical protein
MASPIPSNKVVAKATSPSPMGGRPLFDSKRRLATLGPRRLRSTLAFFVIALMGSAGAPAAAPSLDSLCHDETAGLAVIGHGDVAPDNELPVGTRRLLPGLHGVAGRTSRATGLRHAVIGDHAPPMQVPPLRRLSMPANRRSWIDDAKVLTHQSPRGPPSV